MNNKHKRIDKMSERELMHKIYKKIHFTFSAKKNHTEFAHVELWLKLQLTFLIA